MKIYQNSHLRHIISAAVCLLLICCTLTGCQADNENAGSENGRYRLYYLNEAGTKAERYTYETEEKDVIKLVELMFDSMSTVDVKGALRVIPDGVVYNKAELAGDILYLYIDGSLDGTGANRRMMFYACLTRAIAQLKEVSGLMIFINDQPALDDSGRNMGIMRESKFVNNAIDDPDDYKESEVTLYFAGEKKDKLVKTTVTASYRSSTPIERVVVEQLISGPQGGGLGATISGNVTLLGINVSDGTCYVNFDEKFVTDTISGYDNIQVYSVVNSLIELDGIEKVQISINGSYETSMPMGQINFQAPFTFNEDLVEIK